jgi:hypothetical protein
MSQIDGLIREVITGIGEESSPGTQASTITRVSLANGSVLNTGFAREMLEVPAESPVRWDNPAHALGRTIAGWGPLTWLLRGVPSSQRLESGVTPSTLSHDILLKHAFGRRNAVAGTTISGTSSTTTSINITSTTGRKVGELLAFETAAGQYEARSVATVGSGLVTTSVALGTAPTTATRIVRGVRTFVLAETRNTTLTIEQRMMVPGGTAHEYRVRGAMSSSFTITFGDFGKIPTLALQGLGTYAAGPAALSSPSWSLGSSPADDDMDVPLPWTPVLYVDGAVVRFEPGSLKLTVAQNADPIGDGSTPTGVGGWLDTTGREGGMSVSGEFLIRADSAEVTSYEAGTIRNLLFVCDPNYGASTTTMCVVEIPRAQVIERPKPVSIGAGRHGYLIKFKALRDTKTPSSSSAADTDLALSPIRFGLV